MFINKVTGKKLDCCGYSIRHYELYDNATGKLKEEKTGKSFIFKDAYCVRPGDILEDEDTHEKYVVSDTIDSRSCVLNPIKSFLSNEENKKCCGCNSCNSKKEAEKKPVKYQIVIESDGVKDTIASYKVDGEVKDIKTSKCHIDDTFDFKEGAQVAFKRLMGKDNKINVKEKYALPFGCGLDSVQEGDIICMWLNGGIAVFGKVYKSKNDTCIFEVFSNNGIVYTYSKNSNYKVNLIWRE